MASNSPPFMPPKFAPGPPTAQQGVWEDGPGQFLNPPNTGTPVIYAGTTQTSVIVNAKPKPPRQTHPSAAGSDSKIK
jgi:hypothetical protein